MPVTIRQMTNSEFESFYQWSVEHQAQELMEELNMSQEDAMKATLNEIAEMLPHGLNTEHNYLMTIAETDSEEIAGFIWTVHETTVGKKQCFICDFAIWEPKRRKGYATAALHLAEKDAAEAGCQESVLFVRDDNSAARSLYQKCGYRVLRQEGYGKFMVKRLS